MPEVIPSDKSLLVDASEVRRSFRNGDERMPKWDASMKKELSALTEETPCLVALNPQQRQAMEQEARREKQSREFLRKWSLLSNPMAGFDLGSHLVACGNHCSEVLGKVSTSELEGALLRFTLSWEAGQRYQGSKGRTVEKIDVSNAFINSDLPEN